MKHRKGFTLIELLIVLCIIGIIAASVGPRFSKKDPQPTQESSTPRTDPQPTQSYGSERK